MPSFRRFLLLSSSVLAVFLCLVQPGQCLAQGLEYVKANYTKYEYRIPMRDGKRLFTAVYVPKDTSQSYPFLIDRTPYSIAPYGADHYPKRLGPSPVFVRDGFIFVDQDVRGRYMSEGTFVEVTPHKDKKAGNDVDESTDTYDTIDWLVKNVTETNGKVGILGISYDGFLPLMALVDPHPALKVSVPMNPMVDGWVGDAAISFTIGAPAKEDADLIEATESALAAGIAAARPGGRLGDISAAIGHIGRAGGYGISTDLGGHGVGRTMHEDPHIPNRGKAGRGLRLVPGLVLAIEPWFIAGGNDGIYLDEDGWTIRTSDGNRAAHAEHTIAVTGDGPVILTAG